MPEQIPRQMNAGPEGEAETASAKETLPSLHDMHLSLWDEDLPISGDLSSGQSRADPIVINSGDPEIVARTQMQVLGGLARARGVYWRCLSRELLGDAFPGIEKFDIETIELTPDQKITSRAAYYFDVSALPASDWKPIKGSELFERLSVRFPVEVGWLHLESIKDYETVTPGLGISLAYNAPGVTATLYIYDKGYGIPDDVMRPIVQSEFDAAADDVITARGPYIVAWPDPPFDGRCLRRYFKEGEDAKKCTMLALTAHRGHFVKMLVSWERDEFIDKVALGWLEAILTATFDVQSSIIPMNAATPNGRLQSGPADLLAAEFQKWFRNLETQGQVAPRAFTGITRNGQQVVAILNDIPWTRAEHVQRRAFIHWLCRKENIAAYAVANMMGREDGGREVHIVADDGLDIVQAVLPIEAGANGSFSYGEAKIYRRKPGDDWNPYTDLMLPDSISRNPEDSDDEVFFEDVWGEMRPRAFWRERPLR